MKVVNGICLPDSDTHFGPHLESAPTFQGKGTYQLKKIEKALQLCPTRRVAIDIGAHVGLWSMVLSAYFSKVCAFEPVPEHVECFRRNVTRSNVELSEVALSDAAGSVKIKTIADNSGNAHVVTRGGRNVNAIRLDDLSFNFVDLIKIDVEGFEHAVIRGAEKTIRHFKPVMVVEQKPGHAERYGLEQTEAVRLLESWGARIAIEKAGDFFMTWSRP